MNKNWTGLILKYLQRIQNANDEICGVWVDGGPLTIVCYNGSHSHGSVVLPMFCFAGYKAI